AEGVGNPAWRSRGGEKFRAIGIRPKSQQRPHARGGIGPGSAVRRERDIAQSEVLAEPFVICEQERLVFLERPAERCAKHITLKLRDGAVIEEIARVERAIAQKFICAAVEAIC